MTHSTKEIEDYFEEIDRKLRLAYKVAGEARKKGYDPEDKVEILLVKDMVERVVGLISIVAPQMVGSGIAKRMRELEKKYGALDWRVALVIAEEIAKEKFCKFKDKKEAMEIGIRTGLAYITMGTVASPLEGFVELKIRKTREGKEYFAVFYSGPIRSAGGTGSSVSLLIADYVRMRMGYAQYDPKEEEIQRTVIELYDYHERITNLQYLPSEQEIYFLVKHIPVQIDGDPSEKIEVSRYKDMERIETNNIRSGVCLVIGEGIAQKAPKLWKQLSKWGSEFGLDHWNFLEQFIEIQKKVKARGKHIGEEKRISPDYTYIKDLVAGRPVLTYPLRVGGFRLRYGRSRTSGYSSDSIHPATMFILNKYLATGTQLKMERPGKATALTSCSNIEGPIVKLINGDVVSIRSLKEAKHYYGKIKEILFLGDILINYGDFYNRAHSLVPAGYCEEWWIQELEKATVNLFGSLDLDKLSELVEIQRMSLEILLKNPIITRVSSEAAIIISKKLKIPLHPTYTYHWRTISVEQLLILINWLKKAQLVKEDGKVQKVILPIKEENKRILELLGIPHTVATGEYIVLDKNHGKAFLASLGVLKSIYLDRVQGIVEQNKEKDTLKVINLISEVELKDKSGTFIGARMGRPEKAKMRKLNGSPQILFPVGDEGGRLRCFQSALELGKIKADFPLYMCSKCDRQTIYKICEVCGKKTKRMYYCKICGLIEKGRCQHGEASAYKTQEMDIKHYFDSALRQLKLKTYPDLIKGVRGTSNKEHIPEHLTKGILRAKHEVYVNKDGTTRYDMTQLGITHFRPIEIGTSVKKLKELGYERDIYGNVLEKGNQLVEIKPQDIILPACDKSTDERADKVFFSVANFIDEMLVSLYGLKPFYNLKSGDDLVGHLVLGLAPHTSAAIVGRIIGFSRTQAFYAHPMFHAATRRDLDGDEGCAILLMDALLNFSKNYLPAHRGSTQDAPLVLTSRLTPTEVDDMVFDMDVVGKYPLEFYESYLDYKKPWDIKIEQLGYRLNTEKQYQGFGFTHDTDDINNTVRCSAYKTLPSMEDKLKGQMDLAEKIRAVDEADVAKLVIEKHFLKDTKGNLRKFTMQQFRCVKCNEKYRRPPLIGKCINCGGRIIFTISEGSIIKYMEPSVSLAKKYSVPDYLKQSLELLQRRIEGVFGKEVEKQTGLGKWFG
jgi:DNA polymerase II large subunit